MSKIFTLDSFRAEAEKEYAPTKIDLGDGVVVSLKSLIRLNKNARKAVFKQLDVLNAVKDGADEESDEKSLEDLDALVSSASNILAQVADKPKELLDALDGDLAMLLEVIKEWMRTTQPGEAESSPS